MSETAEVTPRFVYDVAAVQAKIEAVRAAFEGEVAVLYATKANGHLGLLRAMRPALDGADVTSRGAMQHAVDAGFAPDSIQFTSPGKSRADLEFALRLGACVVLGCTGEAQDVVAAAQRLSIPPSAVRTLVRVNPTERIHAFRSATGGVPSPFGIPEEEVDQALPAILALGLAPRGLHVHRGSQCTSATAFARHVTGTLDLADRLVREHGLAPHVNLGGGLGVATQGSPELPLSSLGRRCARALRAFRGDHPAATFALEPGRYFVSEAGTLHLRVLRRRSVRGVTFLVLDGGIDVFLFASERMRHGPPPPIRNATRPDAEPETVTLVGPACTSEDTLVTSLLLPRAEPGDVLVVGHAGAYAAGASMAGFLGRDRATEVLA